MIAQEIVGAVYVLWPVVLAVLVGGFLVGILVALSVGSVVAGGVLAAYYGYLWFKKRGFAQMTDGLKRNIQETFVLRGVPPLGGGGPCLFLAHPHGLFSMAPFFHWGLRLTGWPTTHPVRIAIHSLFFSIPIVREIAEAHNAIEATEAEIEAALRAGFSVVLLTGGVREIHETCAGRMRIVLKRRSGFLRIAQRVGVPIVPVLSFGENELFPPVRGAWMDRIQDYLRRWVHVGIPVPTLASVRHWIRLFSEPLTPAVETWIGRAVREPTLETVVAEMERLYAEGRPAAYPAAVEFV